MQIDFGSLLNACERIGTVPYIIILSAGAHGKHCRLPTDAKMALSGICIPIVYAIILTNKANPDVHLILNTACLNHGGEVTSMMHTKICITLILLMLRPIVRRATMLLDTFKRVTSLITAHSEWIVKVNRLTDIYVSSPRLNTGETSLVRTSILLLLTKILTGLTRISLPDIDTDFEDSGRGKVLDWVSQKYGATHVAHIITYGKMATRSALADVARVQGVPIPTSNQLKSLVPDRDFPDSVKDDKGKKPKVNLRNCYKYIDELRQIYEGDDPVLHNTLEYAAQ